MFISQNNKANIKYNHQLFAEKPWKMLIYSTMQNL